MDKKNTLEELQLIVAHMNTRLNIVEDKINTIEESIKTINENKIIAEVLK